jgi:MFS family permease
MPDPMGFEAPDKNAPAAEGTAGSRRRLNLYGAFTALTMAGFVVFPLLAFHYKALGILPDAEIPVFYAIAMGVDAVVALAVGRAYDRFGVRVLILLPLVGAAIPFVAFSPVYGFALAGAVLWGTSMGMQETVLRAAVADFTPPGGRGFAFGIFNTIYGGAWFAGSVIIGVLYGISIVFVAGFMVLAQIAAMAALWLVVKEPGGYPER